MEVNENLKNTLKEISNLDFTDQAKVEKFRNLVRNILKRDNESITNDERAIFILFLTKEMIYEEGRTYQPSINYGNSLGMLAKANITTNRTKSNGIEKVKLNKNSTLFIYYEALGKRTRMGNKNMPQIIDLMHVVPHEYRHFIQQEKTLNGEMDIDSLKITLDELYRRSLTVKEYTMNWENMDFEKDAEIFGYNQAKKMLAKYAPQLLIKYEKEIDSIIDNIENPKNNTIRRIAKDGRILEVDKNEDRDKFIKSMILEKKEEIKLKYPQIFDLYNEKGNKRSLAEIQEIREARIKTNPEQSTQIDKYFKDITREFEIDKVKTESRKTDKIEYKREISSRDDFSTSATWEEWEKQDINKQHEIGIYHNTRDFDNKTFKYGLNVKTSNDQDYLGVIAYKMGKEYARETKGEKAKLAKQFAILEIQGRMGDFIDPYAKEEVSGYDNPKLLLQIEEVKGLNIEELENIRELDSKQLRQRTFVATYEIEEWDKKLNRKVYKPIKEYYQTDETGELVLIGNQIEDKASFTIDGLEFDIKPYQINQGETIEKVTQKQINDRLIKNGIEDSMQNGKVTEVALITDMEFLKDLAEQCEIPEGWDLNGRTFVISTINEKGEEDFDIIIRSDGGGETEYEHLMGIDTTEKSSKEMYTTNGRRLPGGAKVLDKTKSLKEFITKSGHRYTITRNAEGKLGFDEIFKENENIIQAEHIDTYTYSTDDLTRAYKSMEIDQEDLNKAYDTINRTKAERAYTQNKTKTNKFKGRE